MGRIVSASCLCGFMVRKMFLGGGFLNFQTHDGQPALCDACGAFQVLNYMDNDVRCPECGGVVRFYINPAPDALYPCPVCSQRTLHFAHAGMWD